MNSHVTEEKVKPFRLVKYFTFTSLIVIFIGTMVLAVLNSHWARTMQRKTSEDYALLLAENLNHQVFLQFVIPVALRYGKIQLRNPDQFERMDKVVKNTLHSFKIDMVKIYDMNNIISYSIDKTLVGKENLGGTGYSQAIGGKCSSELIQRGNFMQILMGFPEESKLITSVPFRAEKPLSRASGPVLGVIEIIQNLSDDYKVISGYQILVIKTYALVMGLIFLVLLFIVKRGEGIIEKRALEQMELKEQLSLAKHLSSLGEMIAGISHEIRNPLGIIKSSAELLKKKMAGVDPSNAIPDIIVEESMRLNHIITDFLDCAKPKKPNLLPCRIIDVLEKNITFLSTHMQQQGYSIIKNLQGDVPEISADPDMLYQAFLNILINSMQAMPDGGKIHIDISASASDVIIAFKDEGAGIPQDVLENVWNPFFTTKENGTGLGLGIVRNIIESHGGTIRIENRPVWGAQVTVWLPVLKET